MDDHFSRVASWWNGRSGLFECRALLAFSNLDIGLAKKPWAELDGEVRRRLYFSIRAMVKLGGELGELLK